MLFVLGGLVRSTGAGMGCPDWPKCFGEYIPPTSAEELPDNYKEIFLNNRLEKTERFAALLTKLGFKDKAQEILNYEALNEAHEFSASKAYTEYINRIWGALTGIIVLITFVYSLRFIKENRAVSIFTGLGFIAVMVNALIGAVVVNANLLGGIVTTHFLAAFAAMAFFMIARFNIVDLRLETSPDAKIKRHAFILMILFVVQIIAGTQVREAYDVMEAKGHVLNTETIPLLGQSFNVHRVLALITLAWSYLQMKNYKTLKWTKYVLGLCIAQIVFGSLIVMTDLSAFSKLFHVSIGAGLFVIQFYICALLFKGQQKALETA